MKSDDNFSIEKPIILMVEGEDERSFFYQLNRILIKNQSKEIVKNEYNFQIYFVGGKDEYKRKAETLSQLPNFHNIKRIGITRDANDDFNKSSKYIKEVFKDLVFPIPDKPLKLEKDSNQEKQSIYYILPGYQEKGELEDIFIKTLDQDLSLDCINKFWECCKNNNIKNLTTKKQKFTILSYLATKIDNSQTNSLQKSCNRNDIWDFNHIAFDEIKDFLKLLSSPLD